MKHNDVKVFASYKAITWKYTPERAAWWSGFWERLVRSIKTALKASVGKAKISYDDLATLLTEI